MNLNMKWKKRLTVIVCALLAVCVVLPAALSVVLYEMNFGERYYTDVTAAFELGDFPSLTAERHEFASDAGQKLVGYLYKYEDTVPRALLLLSHGIGSGGQNRFMNVADYFAARGYAVFAYDATGNDESEGRGTKGLPQGAIDLNHAISYAENLAGCGDLPVLLFGHSWGGYSVCSVLTYHPEVTAVCAVSGFNRSSDLLRATGRNMVGGAIDLLMPYVNLWEKLRFGAYAENTGMDGFASSQAKVMIVHSADDTTVPIEYGCELYEKTYADDARFRFVKLENRGHDHVFRTAEFETYLNGINAEFEAAGLPASEREGWMKRNMDHGKLVDALDDELFDQIYAFFEEALAE